MNITILALSSLKSDSSPLFSKKERYTIHKSLFSRQLNSVIYNTKQFQIYNSKFSSSFGPVIMNSASYTNYQTSRITVFDDNNRIYSATFHDIKSAETGACAYISSSTAALEVSACLIYHCFSTKSGFDSGIIYSADLTSLKCQRVYNFENSAYSGSFLIANNVKTIELNQNTLCKTGFDLVPATKSAMYLNGETITVTSHNYSYNYFSGHGACATVIASMKLDMSINYAHKCQGTDLFQLIGSPATSNSVTKFYTRNCSADALISGQGVWPISDSIFSLTTGKIAIAEAGVIIFTNSYFDKDPSNAGVMFDNCTLFIVDYDGLISGKLQLSTTSVNIRAYTTASIALPEATAKQGFQSTFGTDSVTVFIILIIILLVLLFIGFIVYYYFFSRRIRSTVVNEYHNDLISNQKFVANQQQDNVAIDVEPEIDDDEIQKPLFVLDA